LVFVVLMRCGCQALCDGSTQPLNGYRASRSSAEQMSQR
jgi:hypothetical protein